MGIFGEPPPPVQAPPAEQERTGTLDTPPAIVESAPADAPAEKATPLAAPEVVPGVPLWVTGLDGDPYTVYWLAALDQDASHEAGQPTRHAGIDGDRQVAGVGDPIERSGGSAYYYDAVGGKGFSRPIGKAGA